MLKTITRHLNKEHLEDLLACTKATEGFDWAEQATVTQLDGTGITLDVRNGAHQQSLRLDFPATAATMMSLRELMVDLISQSRAKLGWQATVDDH